MRKKTKLSLLGMLAATSVLIAACGGSGAGLIPLKNAGPLQADFEEVLAAARQGEGQCGPTKSAVAKTQKDFEALPSTVDSGLRSTLAEGIANLKIRALALCAQPATSTATATGTATESSTTSTTSSTASSTTSTTETSTSETTTETSTSETTSETPPAESGTGGGTPAPEGSVEEGNAGVGGAVP